YDDLLLVRTWISALGKASVAFDYEVLDAEGRERRLAAGRTRHAVVNELWKPARLPEDLRTALSAFLRPEPASRPG
ncbi:MAG: acyl-CoA thioesterase, partial [Elusimicrobia bacterium]|nr:acyl-CoA thioesterase [Elusimicrobiota bacterium]